MLLYSVADVFVLELLKVQRGAKGWNCCVFSGCASITETRADCSQQCWDVTNPEPWSAKWKMCVRIKQWMTLRLSELPACGDGRRSWCDCHTVGVSSTACYTARSRNWSLLPPVSRHKKATWSELDIRDAHCFAQTKERKSQICSDCLICNTWKACVWWLYNVWITGSGLPGPGS